MSSHSRSSSEVLTLQYSDILRVFFKPFRDNFDFDDVKEYVKHLFTKDEYESINNEQNANHRLVLLFEILCAKESIIPKFLDNINQDYKFLADPIRDELKNPSKLTAIYMDKVHQLRSNFPKHADFNVLRVNMYVRLRDALRNLKRYHSVVLQGDLGTGKKWLTISVCYDYSVMKSMGFQIYWLDVSDCESPEQDLHRLQQLRLMLGDASASHSPTFMNGGSNGFASVYHEKERVKYNESILNRVFELQQCLRKHLIKPAHRNCLVILKDVKNFKTFQTFNLGCKLLVITRIRKIYESLSSKISTNLPIDSSLTLSEFYGLFEKYLLQTRDRFPKHAFDIYKYSDGNPYLLSIIAQNLRQKKSPWNEWIRNLQKFEIPNEKFSTIVELSLNVLNEELLGLYATLTVFPPSVLIPIKLLAFIWDKTLEDADNIVKRFNKYSFVSKEPCNIDEDCDDCCCIIPLTYSSHLRGSKRMRSMINSINLHEKVIKYYNIEQLFTQRTEIDLCSSQHDHYFYSFIGYHLYEAGRSSLFPKLYLDFGFLEQKIRAVGLSNTISDLKYFEKEIINSDYRRPKLLAEIREFLPKVEEKLTESRDTSLLQYALMAVGEVYEEATLQIRLFPQRVWFSEHGNFHKRRQIVSLINQAKFIKFFDQDMCFIVLVNGNMLLLDISIDCPTKPILLKDDYGHHHHNNHNHNNHNHKESGIVEAHLFGEHKFLITLDIGGVLKVWSLSDDNRRAIVYRRSSRQKANYYTMESNHKIQIKNSKQRIDVNSMGQPGFIVAFFIEQLPPNRNNETNLHIAFSDGDISVYEWNIDREEFKPKKIPILQTKAHDIRFVTKILNTYYMLLSKSGKISFWNLRDSSKAFVPFDWPKQTCGPLSYEQSTFINDDDDRKTLTRAIFVFPDKVLSLIFEHKTFSSKPDGYVEILYENHWDMKSAITCAKLTDDQNYLVLGTKRGLIVYDLLAKSEVLRCNVSDAIACVDVYALDDNVFKYVIICGAEHRKALYIFAVRKHGENEITWAHNVTSMGNKMSTDPQLEPDVWLLGQMLYDIDYVDDGSLVLAAVDSKYRVHQVNTTTTDSWPIIIPRETSEPITSIAIGKELGFVGYSNGDIFNIKKDAFENEAMSEAIIYLKIIDDCHLIASTENQTLISNVGGTNDDDGITCTYGFGTKQCYKIKRNCFLLISSAGVITLIEERANKYEQKFQMDGLRENVWDTYTLCGCDFQHDHLCLASANTVKVYYFAFYKDSPPRVRSIINSLILNPPQNQKISISCVALAKDASLTAIGYTNGNIEIYKVHDMPLECLYRLQSHRTRIYDMKFSPGNEILVSCAEQLCFWNVLHILNNQLIKNSPKRRSSRFSSQRSYETTTEEVDAKMVSQQQHENHLNIHLHGKNGGGAGGAGGGATNEHGDDVILLDAVQRILVTNGIGGQTTASVWRDKQGPADKPELLSCIKFDGRKAEKFFANPDFTQFNTIDDEGVYYHLILFNNNNNNNYNEETPMDVARLDIIDIAPRHFSLNTDVNSLGEDEVYV